MKQGWRSVSLREVLTPVERAEPPLQGVKYRQLGVQLWGRGAYERESLDGGSTRYKTLYRVATNDVVVNKIWARNGSVAVVQSELDGCFVSGEFPFYTIRPELMHPDWMHWMTKTRTFWDMCDEKSQGTSGKNRIRPEKFLDIEIPLPPLDEQRRIVACIEGLVSKVMAANELVEQSVAETDAILQSKLHDIFVTRAQQWKQSELGSLVLMDDKQVDPTLPQFSNIPHISGENMESGTCRLPPYRTAAEDGVKSGKYLFSPGTVLYSKIRPYLRKAIFVDFRGVCSADVYPIRCVDGEIDPHFLKWALIAGPFTEYANRLSGRTRMPKLNRKQLKSFVLSYPSLREQKRIAALLDYVQAKMCEVRGAQEMRKEELNALIPSILDKAFKGEL